VTSHPDDRAPAIAGVAQIVQRPGEVALDDARGPIELMVDAARAAARDAGTARLLERVGFVGVAGGWFRYTNPGQLVADRIGASGAATALTAISGTSPQDLVGLAAQRIARGELDVALILGGEARWSHQRIKRQGHEPRWVTDPGEGTPETFAPFPAEMMSETMVFGGAPPAYAIFEDRLRVASGASVDAHRDRIAALWARFSAVAARNPHAWDRHEHTADAIRNASPENRMIAFPYTKAMVANNTVDMATAILLCSAETVRALGIARDRLVYPQAVVSGRETWLVAERRELHRLPGLAAAARATFAHLGLGIDDIAHLDLYACFPSMVEITAATLGVGSDRELTVTGGLGFAGAPVGNAVGHAIAAMVERVRGGGLGLVHGNGGQATKQSFAVYATEPPPGGFARLDVQESVDLAPRATLPADWWGPVTVEAATLVFDRHGPARVIAGVLDATGARGWATSADPRLFEPLTTEGIAGQAGHRSSSGELAL
jgi:acetyl-CoA C-acetyltransferase